VAAWIFVVIFVAVAHPAVEEYLLQNTSLYDKVYEYALQSIEKKAEQLSEDTPLGDWYAAVTGGLPNDVTEELKDTFSLDALLPGISEQGQMKGAELQEYLNSTKLSIGDLGGYRAILQFSNGQQTLQEKLAAEVAERIMNGLGVLLSFIIAVAAVFLVGILVKAIGMVPVVRQVNGLMGLLLGAAEGFLLVWVLLFIVACFGSTSMGQTIISCIDQNKFLVFLYENNFLLRLF
jgi:hypothetical protein